MIDLTLNDLLVPDIVEYIPEFGTKIIRTPTNKGGLSTAEVADNVAMPFHKQRPVVIDDDDTTTVIQYNANIELAPESAGITLQLGNGAYTGCLVSVTNTSQYRCSVRIGSELKPVFSGKMLIFVWDGSKWNLLDLGGGSGSGSVLVLTTAEYNRRAAITDMEDDEYIPNNALVVITDAEDEYLYGEVETVTP